MTATSQIAQLGSLAGLNVVRIHLITNKKKLIPDWVEEWKNPVPITPVDMSGDGMFIEDRDVSLAGLIFALAQEGFALAGVGFRQAGGDHLRLCIVLERDGVSIPDEQVSDIMEATREGRWVLRADRNRPIGGIVREYIQITARNRTMRPVPTGRLLGVSDSTIALF